MKDDARERPPVTAFDVSDENPDVLANLLRAVQREMRSGFEMLREEMRHLRADRTADYDRLTDLERYVRVQDTTLPKRKAKK